MDDILQSSHFFQSLRLLEAVWRNWRSDPGVTERPRPRRISPPTPGHSEDEYWAYIEFQGAIYRLLWSGSPRCPSLADFPVGCNIEQVKLSAGATQTWKHTALLGHGADSCIREDSNLLPIIKLAHPDPIARERLSHEFEVLRRMSRVASLPIPRFCPEPLTDQNGIYGYRMERLRPLNFDQLPRYYEAVREALDKVHQAGFALGDLHPGNTMLNDENQVVFIDLAHAGKVGEKIPSSVPTNLYQLPNFHTEPDIEKMVRWFTSSHSTLQATVVIRG